MSRRLTRDWERVFGRPRSTFYYESLKDRIEESRPLTKFNTGSSYLGTWNNLGMTKKGQYTFPHNVKFEGDFDDNQFITGTYTYPMGQRVIGGFEKEKYVVFNDGLVYHNDDWNYLSKDDRRYAITIKDGFKPTTEERVTNANAPRKILDGCYDVGDGFYNPTLKCVVSAIDKNTIIRIPTASEEKWIEENCRMSWDEPVGYRPSLYETWTIGKGGRGYKRKSLKLIASRIDHSKTKTEFRF